MPRKKQSTNDPHQRFAEWLEGIGAEDPPRDLAVHAAVCVDCQGLIAAVDTLTVDRHCPGWHPAGATRSSRSVGCARRDARRWPRAVWRPWW